MEISKDYRFISLEIENGTVFIGEDGASGSSYKAETIEDIVEAVKIYLLDNNL